LTVASGGVLECVVTCYVNSLQNDLQAYTSFYNYGTIRSTDPTVRLQFETDAFYNYGFLDVYFVDGLDIDTQLNFFEGSTFNPEISIFIYDGNINVDSVTATFFNISVNHALLMVNGFTNIPLTVTNLMFVESSNIQSFTQVDSNGDFVSQIRAIINVTNLVTYSVTVSGNISMLIWSTGYWYPNPDILSDGINQFSTPAYLTVYGELHVYTYLSMFSTNVILLIEPGGELIAEVPVFIGYNLDAELNSKLYINTVRNAGTITIKAYTIISAYYQQCSTGVLNFVAFANGSIPQLTLMTSDGNNLAGSITLSNSAQVTNNMDFPIIIGAIDNEGQSLTTSTDTNLKILICYTNDVINLRTSNTAAGCNSSFATGYWSCSANFAPAVTQSGTGSGNTGSNSGSGTGSGTGTGNTGSGTGTGTNSGTGNKSTTTKNVPVTEKSLAILNNVILLVLLLVNFLF